jgi:hypothetical protein
MMARSAGSAAAAGAATSASGDHMFTALGIKERDHAVDFLTVTFVTVNGRIGFLDTADYLELAAAFLAFVFVNRHIRSSFI